MKTFLTAFTVASALLITGSALAGATSTRGAFAAMDARRAAMDQNRSAYALTGEQTKAVRAKHYKAHQQGGRNAG